MGHHEKAKPKNDRDRRTPAQRHRKYIQQDQRRKRPQPKERYVYILGFHKDTRYKKKIQNIK